MPQGSLELFLQELMEKEDVWAAAGSVGTAAETLTAAGRGLTRPDVGKPVTASTLFDMASLTKPFMATLALFLDNSGALPLDLELGQEWPRVAPALATKTMEDLLRHQSGLVPWIPLYRRCRSRGRIADLLLSRELLGAKPGTYSDLGYIMWGLTAERRCRESLQAMLRRHVLLPLGAKLARPVPGDRSEAAESRLDNERERELANEQGIKVAHRSGPHRGAPQDGNVRFLGGLAGHAGLFACVNDVSALAREWLNPGTVLFRAQVDRALAGSGRWALGWERRRSRGSGGRSLSPEAFGHTGFTGGSVWVDPSSERRMVLLAHRSQLSVDLDPWRRKFHGLAQKL